MPITVAWLGINYRSSWRLRSLGDVIDTERLLADAETAVERAKQQGRNRVERVDGYPGTQPVRSIT